MSSLPHDAPSPRLCIVVKWPDFDGYGFNLHAEKSKPGQYIGKVDDNSPAETAGLKEDDRIIEVNGVNIANENHKQVVQRIKAVPNETRLLVLDPAADKYYKNKNIVVRGSQENVVVRSSVREEITTPTTTPTEPQTESVSNGRHDETDNRSVSSHASSSATSETSTQPQHTSQQPPQPSSSEVTDTTVVESVEDVTTTTTTPPTTPQTPPPSPPQTHSNTTMESEANVVTLTINTEEPTAEDVSVVEEGVAAMNVENNVEEEEESNVENTDVDLEGPSNLESDLKDGERDPKEETEDDDNEANEAKEQILTPTEQESDLEAEYDNVDIDLEAHRDTQQTSDSPRLSVSSGKSSCSNGPSDTQPTPDDDDDDVDDDATAKSPMSTSPTPPPSLDPEPPLNTTASPATNNTTTTTSTTTTNGSTTTQPVPNKNTYNTSGLNLNMSAAEMRAMLARKKKTDPRKETVDLKTKYEIIQNM